jgi:hypothetical protein
MNRFFQACKFPEGRRQNSAPTIEEWRKSIIKDLKGCFRSSNKEEEAIQNDVQLWERVQVNFKVVYKWFQ